MHRWNPGGHAGSGLPEDTPQAAPLYPPLPPSRSTSLRASQRAFHVQGTSRLLCFANLGKALHSLKCLKNLHSKVSANTGERNAVEKGQHRSLGSCLDNSFPQRGFRVGVGGRGGLDSGFHYGAEGGALQKEQKKDIKKARCSVRTSWSSRTPLKKQEVNACALLGLPSSLSPEGQQPSWKGCGPALSKGPSLTVTWASRT